MTKYLTATTWYNMKRRGKNPPITNVRTRYWSITISLKDGTMMATIQEILLKLAEDPAFRASYKEKEEGKVHAAIYWNAPKTGQWILKQLDGTDAHIEPAIDAKTLTRWISKS